MYLAQIKVMLKKSVFDPQGTAVQHTLETLGYDEIESVRIGKLIEVKILASDKKEAESMVDKMCDQLLANPVVESYIFNLDEVA